MSHRFDPAIIREYDVRGTVDKNLNEAEGFALLDGTCYAAHGPHADQRPLNRSGDNLRIEWDLDYDPKAGRMGADNLFAGYSWGRTTVGMGHALLNAVDETGSAASIIKSQQVQPFLSIGKPNGAGFNLAANGGYDFVHGALQYAGVQAIYNWDCCGLSFGYRRFALGSVRNETQWLYSFTLANFGSVGDIRRSNTAFRDPTLPPAY